MPGARFWGALRAMAWALKLPLADEVIESGLVQDFDASLSGIGQELGAGAYSMRYRGPQNCQGTPKHPGERQGMCGEPQNELEVEGAGQHLSTYSSRGAQNGQRHPKISMGPQKSPRETPKFPGVPKGNPRISRGP